MGNLYHAKVCFLKVSKEAVSKSLTNREQVLEGCDEEDVQKDI